MTLPAAEISASLKAEVKSASVNANRGKGLLDKMKAEGETLSRTNAKSERLQVIRAKYLVLCKAYVETVKRHQQSKDKIR